MRSLLSEVVHKLLVAVIGVGAGMTALWYSQTHHQNMWILGGIAAAGTLIVGLLFHPILFLFRHRPRRYVHTAETSEV